MRLGSLARTGILLASLFSFTEGLCRATCRSRSDGLPEGRLLLRDVKEPRALEPLFVEPLFVEPDEEHDLRKRALQALTPANIDNYVVARTDAVQGNAQRNILFDDSRSTSLFVPLGATSFDLGIKELCGCTLLVIASQTHVYAAHYFEDLAFDNTDPNANPPVTQNTASLRRNALDFLQNGGTATWNSKKVGPGLAANVQHFPAITTHAWIMTPVDTAQQGNPQPLLYDAKIQQIRNKVNDLINVLPDVYRYDPIDQGVAAQLPQFNTARGRGLYQYDVDPNGTKSHRLLLQRFEAFSEGIP